MHGAVPVAGRLVLRSTLGAHTTAARLLSARRAEPWPRPSGGAGRAPLLPSCARSSRWAGPSPSGRRRPPWGSGGPAALGRASSSCLPVLCPFPASLRMASLPLWGFSPFTSTSNYLTTSHMRLRTPRLSSSTLPATGVLLLLCEKHVIFAFKHNFYFKETFVNGGGKPSTFTRLAVSGAPTLWQARVCVWGYVPSAQVTEHPCRRGWRPPRCGWPPPSVAESRPGSLPCLDALRPRSVPERLATALTSVRRK